MCRSKALFCYLCVGCGVKFICNDIHWYFLRHYGALNATIWFIDDYGIVAIKYVVWEDDLKREYAPVCTRCDANYANHTFCQPCTSDIIYRGADFSIVWPQFIVLIIIGSVFLHWHCYVFRKTISAMA